MRGGWILGLAIVAGISQAVGALGPMTYRYFYDELNQLVKVVDSHGNVVEYVYDEVGNMLEVKSGKVASTLAIFGITPEKGGPATLVSVQGQGFSANAAGEAVSFNGIPAIVESATGGEIRVRVPAQATSGSITVQVNGESASSPHPFTVVPLPLIASLSQRYLPTPVAGIDIRVQGQNLGGSAFAFEPRFEPPKVDVVSASVNGAGTEAILHLNVDGPAGGTFILVAANAAGASSGFPDTGNSVVLVRGGAGDADGDGLPDVQELVLGTNPYNPDSDKDGYSDGLEVALGSNPLDPASIPVFARFAPLSYSPSFSLFEKAKPVSMDSVAQAFGMPWSLRNTRIPDTSPAALSAFGPVYSFGNSHQPPPDSLSTRLSSGSAFFSLGNLRTPLDFEGIPHAPKQMAFTSPISVRNQIAPPALGIHTGVYPDSDGDGLPDIAEVLYGTDPFNPDTDGDGFPDGVEVAGHADPRDPGSRPAGDTGFPEQQAVSPVISVQEP